MKRTAPVWIVMILLFVSAPLLAQQESDEPLADPGWSMVASTIGIISAGVTGGFLLIGLATSDRDVQMVLGGGALIVGLVTVPVISAGGSSARNSHPDVTGMPANRLVGWIGYGVFGLIGGAAMVAAATGDDIGAALVLPVVLLGMSVELAFGFDARVSGVLEATQIEEQLAARVSISPTVGAKIARTGEIEGIELGFVIHL